jgi:hypothetical protein
MAQVIEITLTDGRDALDLRSPTERMQEHYSTVHGSEQRDGIARVISLLGTPSGGSMALEVGSRSRKPAEASPRSRLLSMT